MSQVPLDIDPDSRAALEFDDVIAWIADLARSAPGKASIRTLEPSADAAWVRAELDAVAEVAAHLAREGPLVPSGIPDPQPALPRLGIAGSALDAVSLRDLAAFVDAASTLGQQLRALPVEYPVLAGLGRDCPDLRREAREVLRAVEPDGTLRDDASRELARVRAARRRVGERLQSMLRGLLRDPHSAAAVRDDFITQRNGRFVIPVRTDAPQPVRGIVHATSSSGATRFVEPLASVDLNNDLVRLAEEEQQEIERLLLAWTDAFRVRREEVQRLVQRLARADSLAARASFAQANDAVVPRVGTGEPVVLHDVRHPLLDRHLRAQGHARPCVPLRVTLDPADRVLVLSGPNAGGKTVALKTIGLAVLMAQAGIPVPARELRLPLYAQLRADIGDHQSIQADLSTFSAHVRAVADFLRSTRPPAMFLFDEIGSGTEPGEGAALARAILEELARPGMTTVATTHLGALKAWAVADARAVSAAMEFDKERLEPTYRVQMGAAGVSAGLEIARRHGLAAGLVERARSLLGDDARQGEEYLERLRDELAAAERERGAAADREAELAARQRHLEHEARQQREALKQQASRKLERALADFEAKARRALAEIRERRGRARAERIASRVAGGLRADQDRLRQALGPDPARAGWVAPEHISEGDDVWVPSLGRTGRVAAVRGERVEVLLGRMTITVERERLRVDPDQAEPSAAARPASSPTVRWEAHEHVPSELKLLGLTVDEALPAVDKFLDDAALAGLGEVRIIHGHGTGRLRNAVRAHLRGHVHVASQRPGRPTEGGDGATIATLS